MLVLPHPNSIKKHLGSFDRTGSESDALETIKGIFRKLHGLQKSCLLLFDEIYIKPSIRYRGQHVIGHANDEPEKPARTVLTLMLKPLISHEAFVMRLIPVDFMATLSCCFVMPIHFVLKLNRKINHKSSKKVNQQGNREPVLCVHKVCCLL